MMQEKISPFTPGSPARADLFAGREGQIWEVSNYLTQAAHGRMENVFLVGDRGIGKSSFASFILEKARAGDNFVGVHVHWGGANTLEEMARRVVEELVNEIRRYSWHDELMRFVREHVRSVGVFGARLEFQPPRQDLAHIVSSFPNVLGDFLARIVEHNKGAIIILDDINGLAETPMFAHWYKSMADYVATHFESYPVLIMVSGLPENRVQLADHQPSLLRVFRVIELGRLSDWEVENFFGKAFSQAGIRIESDAMSVMVVYSGGLPAMMQEIGNAVFWEDQDGVVDLGDAIEGVFNAAMDVGRKYLNPKVYDTFRNERYQAIIRKLGTYPVQQGFTRRQVADSLTSEELRVFDNFLRRLRELRVVEMDHQGGRGAYRYTNQIFPVYMLIEAERRLHLR